MQKVYQTYRTIRNSAMFSRRRVRMTARHLKNHARGALVAVCRPNVALRMMNVFSEDSIDWT